MSGPRNSGGDDGDGCGYMLVMLVVAALAMLVVLVKVGL